MKRVQKRIHTKLNRVNDVALNPEAGSVLASVEKTFYCLLR